MTPVSDMSAATHLRSISQNSQLQGIIESPKIITNFDFIEYQIKESGTTSYLISDSTPGFLSKHSKTNDYDSRDHEIEDEGQLPDYVCNNSTEMFVGCKKKPTKLNLEGIVGTSMGSLAQASLNSAGRSTMVTESRSDPNVLSWRYR